MGKYGSEKKPYSGIFYAVTFQLLEGNTPFHFNEVFVILFNPFIPNVPC